MTCTCGHQENGTTETEVIDRMETHMTNEHSGKSSDLDRMMRKAEKTIVEELYA